MRDVIFVTLSVLVGAIFGGLAYSVVAALLPETSYRAAIGDALATGGAFSGLVWGLVNRHKREDKT